jgi:predicted O-methyltransferase YrrM
MTPAQLFAQQVANPGCDTRDHLPYLREIAKGNVLEIGVRGGVSTSALLLGVEEHGGSVFSIDIDGSCGAVFAGHPQWMFGHLNSNDPGAVMRMIFGKDAEDVFAGRKNCRIIDVMFLDSTHEYAPTLAELRDYSPIIKPGGLITMHDVEGGMYPGCAQAMSEFVAERKWQSEIRHGSWGLGVIRVP